MFASLALLSLAALVRAELNPSDVSAIQERFTDAELNPLFGANNLTTKGLVQAKWSSGATISIGNPLNPTDAANFPWGENSTTFNINPIPDAGDAFSNSSLYTAILFDAQQVGTNLTNGTSEKLHWLINNIHLQTNVTGGPYPLLYDNGTTVKQYQGPNPPVGDAPHRYVILVYKQPANFTAPAAYSTQDQIATVSDFDFPQYVSDANLTEIVGATFFTVVQPGQTQSVAPTPTATQNITAPTDGTSNGNSSSGNGTNSGAGNSTASSPAASNTSGAAASSKMGLSVFGIVAIAAVAALL